MSGPPENSISASGTSTNNVSVFEDSSPSYEKLTAELQASKLAMLALKEANRELREELKAKIEAEIHSIDGLFFAVIQALRRTQERTRCKIMEKNKLFETELTNLRDLVYRISVTYSLSDYQRDMMTTILTETEKDFQVFVDVPRITKLKKMIEALIKNSTNEHESESLQTSRIRTY